MTTTQTLETASIGHPITRGGVSLFPIYLHQTASGLDYQPAISESANGNLVIDEHNNGTVANLTVTSHANEPILIPQGDTMIGGLQNRTFNTTVLLAAKFDGPVPVSCVEAGRWGHHSEFRHGETLAPRRVRRTTTSSVTSNMSTSGARYSDQSSVWDSVDSELHRAQVDSRTRSAYDAYETTHHRVGELAELGPLPGQHGVIASFGRRIVAADVFEHPHILAAYWRSIVNSLAFDAGHDYQGRPSATNALRFLRRVAHSRRAEHPGVSLGVEMRIADARVEAQGLRVGDSLIHLSAFAA